MSAWLYSIYTILLSNGNLRIHWGLLMGYIIKVQKVDRPTNRSFYLNLPTVLAEALDIQKGEQLRWSVEDKNTLVLSRVRAKKARRLRSNP